MRMRESARINVIRVQLLRKITSVTFLHAMNDRLHARRRVYTLYQMQHFNNVHSGIPVALVLVSLTLGSSLSNYVSVALLMMLLLSELMAYKGALPPRSSHVCANGTQTPDMFTSAGTAYRRAETDGYRIDTGMLASHSGSGLDSLGEFVSCAASSLTASRLRTKNYTQTVVFVVLHNVHNVLCFLRCRC